MADIYSSSPIYIVGGEEKIIAIGDMGPSYKGKYRIRFFDIDGTILKLEYASAGREIIPPEETPNFDPEYLTFSGWNYNIDDLQVEGPMDIGAMYTTGGDICYAFIDLNNLKTDEDYTVSIGVSTYSAYEVDWGDGIITTDTISHTYNNIGKYIIKITGYLNNTLLLTKNHLLTKAYLGNNYVMAPNQGTFADAKNIKYVSFPRAISSNYSESTQNLFKNASSLIHCNLPYFNKAISLGSYGFSNCVSLKTISLSQNVKLSGGAFDYTYQLRDIIFPKGTEIAASYAFTKCGATYMTIPSQTSTTLRAAGFYGGSLKYIIVPEGITTLGDSCFLNNNINFIDLPSTLTTIESNALSNNAFHTVIVRSTTVPVFNSSDQLGYTTDNNNYGLTVWVNDNILEELKVADKWARYAPYMRPLSQYEGDY